MKKVILFVSFLSIYCISVEGFSQSKLNYEISSGYISNLTNKNVLGNWDHGWLFGFVISYSLTPSIKLLANVSYQNLSYVGGNININYPDDEGFRTNIEGESTNVTELSLATRFVNNDNFIKPYLTLRGGLFITDIGKILVEDWWEDNPGKKYITIYPGSGMLVKEGFASLGFGVIIPLTLNINLILESRLVSTFTTNNDLVPITSSIQFNF
ncbi:MAG: hypothetical protein ACE5JB_02755 [bacterium]